MEADGSVKHCIEQAMVRVGICRGDQVIGVYGFAGVSGAGQFPGISTPLTLTSTQFGGVIWILIF